MWGGPIRLMMPQEGVMVCMKDVGVAMGAGLAEMKKYFKTLNFNLVLTDAVKV